MKKILLLAIVVIVLRKAASFNPHKVYRILPGDEEQMQLLENFQQLYADDIIFWKFPKVLEKTIDAMVSPGKQDMFLRILKSNRIPHVTYIEHVESLIAQSYIDRANQTNPFSYDWNSYKSLDDMYKWMNFLAELYQEHVTIVIGGYTHEGRDIKGLRLSFTKEDKPAVFIEGGINPREYISSAIVTYLLNQFLSTSSKTLTSLARSYVWYFFPIINPDGYSYTYQQERNIKQRMWSKTRSSTYSSPNQQLTLGTDLNTNWKILTINNEYINKEDRIRYYEGKWPFAEVEARTLAHFIATIGTSLFAYISFRGYGQELMFPYGYTTNNIFNYDYQFYVASEVVDAIRTKYGREYAVGSIRKLKGPMYGNSLDWIKDYTRAPLVYAFEMRDTGHGFLQPPREIVHNGKEALVALVAMFNIARNINQTHKERATCSGPGIGCKSQSQF